MAFKHFLAAAVFALSTSVVLAVPHNEGPNSCGHNQFWYGQKSCCLPHGGPPQPPPPPPGKSCPPSNWYWHPEQGCCVPNHPPPPNPPPPQCGNGWDWEGSTSCCKPHHNPPPPPKPSQGYNHDGDDHGHGGYGGPWKKAKRNATAPPKCPRAYQACPLGDLSGADYECIDTSAELRSCGGCASLNQGQDCTAIKGAWNVGCEVGECTVYTCALGFKVSADKRSCVPIF